MQHVSHLQDQRDSLSQMQSFIHSCVAIPMQDIRDGKRDDGTRMGTSLSTVTTNYYILQLSGSIYYMYHEKKPGLWDKTLSMPWTLRQSTRWKSCPHPFSTLNPFLQAHPCPLSPSSLLGSLSDNGSPRTFNSVDPWSVNKEEEEERAYSYYPCCKWAPSSSSPLLHLHHFSEPWTKWRGVHARRSSVCEPFFFFQREEHTQGDGWSIPKKKKVGLAGFLGGRKLKSCWLSVPLSSMVPQ